MSHVVTNKIRIESLEALKRAGARCGLKFVEGQRTYRWYMRHVGDYPLPEGMTADQMGHCDHALVTPDAYGYDVGVIAQPDGSYKLIYDFYGSGGRAVEKCAGKGLDDLTQLYQVEAAKAQAWAEGWMVEEQAGENGTINLVLVQ